MSTDPLSDFDGEILRFLQEAGVPAGIAVLETPAQREFGERASNVAFRLAREWRKPPRQIAEELAGRFAPDAFHFLSAVEPAGSGFINFRLNYTRFFPHAIDAVRASHDHFGRRESVGQRVVVEHTSVNPNKEWHIGHVRNAVLGDVVVRILRLAGHEVETQNYIDDTGLQAAQAIFGLRAFPETPEAGEKYDHFVGRAYVKVAGELAAEKHLQEQLAQLESRPEETLSAAESAQVLSMRARLENIKRLQRGVLDTMHALESGEYHGTTEGILNAQLLTAYRLGIFYDLLNWESHLVQSHMFDEAVQQLEESPRVTRPTQGRYAGTLAIETAPPGPGEDTPKCEVLIRSNGIATYVAKDIAFSMWKFRLIPDRLCYVRYAIQPNGRPLDSTALTGHEGAGAPPDRVINVIAVDQSLAQEAVRAGLTAAGFGDAARRLFHLAYGLVNTVEGRQSGEKMSGRKGTAVAGDAVIDEAVRVALERVREKRSQDLTDEDMEHIAEAVGVGAVRYFMTQYNPMREIVFDVSNVVSYDGNTGLYVQYALVRMFAILRRAQADLQIEDEQIDSADSSLLQHEQEKRLIYQIALLPDLIATSARTLAVNLVAEYAFELATIFSQFYRDCGVLNAEPEMRLARLLLVRTVRDVLRQVCDLLGVPVIERL